MSSTLSPCVLVYKAAAAIAKGKVVKAGADREHVAVAALATDKALGLLQNAPDAAEALAEVAVAGGGKGLAGGSISTGDLVASDSNGALVATTTANDRAIGIALEDAVSGDLFSVLISQSNV